MFLQQCKILKVQSRLPSFEELLKREHLPSHRAILGHCQPPPRMETAIIRTSTDYHNTTTMPSHVRKYSTIYPFEHGSARKAATPEESKNSDTRENIRRQ